MPMGEGGIYGKVTPTHVALVSGTRILADTKVSYSALCRGCAWHGGTFDRYDSARQVAEGHAEKENRKEGKENG